MFNLGENMFFVPRDVAEATIKELLDNIKKRDAEKSAEWRRNYVRTINVDK